MPEFEITKADLNNPHHQDAVVKMMDAYAADPMGDAQPLSEYARANLTQGLQNHPTTLIFLAMQQGAPVGIATCFRGFSTFAAKPLLNISDFFVVPTMRGRGIGRMLLGAVHDEGVSIGCCKLSLEVQQNNARAHFVYGKFGFAQAVYAADKNAGGSVYMTMSIQ